MKNPVIKIRRWFEDDIFRRLFKNAGILLSGNIGASGIGLVSTALTARALGPEVFGILVLITTYALVIDKLVNFQSWQAIIKYGADALETGKKDGFALLIKFGFLLDGGTAILGAVIAASGAWIVGQWRGWDANVVMLATLYSGTILFHISGTPQAILRLFNKFKLFSFQKVIASIIKLLGVTLAFVFRAELRAFLIMWALTDIVGNVLLIYFATRELALNNVEWLSPCSVKSFGEHFPGIWRFVLTSNLNSSIRMASREVDVFVIGALLSPASVGLFKIAKQVSSLLGKISDPLYQSIYPELAKLASTYNWNRMLRVSIRSALMIGAFAAAGWLMALLFGEQLIVFIFGSAYEEVYLVMVWYMFAILLAIITFPLTPLMLSLGLTTQALRNYIVSTVTYFVLIFVTISTFGVVGAGVSYVGFYFIWIFFTVMSLRSVWPKKKDCSDETM